MGEKIDFKKLKAKVKFEEIKRKALTKLHDGAVWLSENKEWVIPLVTVAGGAAIKGTRAWNRHREDVIRNRRFYDPRRGRYTTARRNLTARELRIIDDRFERGESYRQILDDMGLI